MNIALWMVQGLLALAILFAGFSKVCLPLTTVKRTHEKQHAIFHELRSTFEQHIADVFQQAINAGEIVSDIPTNVIATMYQGLVIALLQHLHSSKKDAVRIAVPRLVSTLLDGSPLLCNKPVSRFVFIFVESINVL